MKGIGMKRPDITDEKYREQKLITDQAILQYIVDTETYISNLELVLYKKNEEIEELKEKYDKLCRGNSLAESCHKVEGKPYGDPMDD